MLSQVERQLQTPDYIGKRALNFTGLETDLAESRILELDSLLENATVPELQAFNSEELTSYYIERIRRYEHYNAVLELNPDALTIARERDQERKSNPLHGLPILLKDNIGTGDKMHTTAGAKALENSHCDRDAFLVQQLRKAGAVILGKCNLSEWANFMSFDSASGFSVLGGQVRNAYGRFDVGGSSSGSGSAAALNLAAFTIGTETSGSLVSPASQNSVCTLKPSLGLISRDRIIPITEKQDTAGPITRNMTDLVYLLNVLVAVDEDDPQTQAAASLADFDFTACLDKDALRGKRLGFMVRDAEMTEKVGNTAIIAQALESLKDAGATVLLIEAPTIEFNLLSYCYGMHAGVNAYLQAIGDNRSLSDIRAFNASDRNHAPFGQDLLELCAKTPLNRSTANAYERIHFNNAANSRNASYGCLDAYALDALVDLNNYGTIAYAMSGLPAVSVPTGYRDSGEPVGLTFWGRYLQDPELIALAYSYECITKARKAPKPSA
jgi:amidase